MMTVQWSLASTSSNSVGAFIEWTVWTPTTARSDFASLAPPVRRTISEETASTPNASRTLWHGAATKSHDPQSVWSAYKLLANFRRNVSTSIVNRDRLMCRSAFH